MPGNNGVGVGGGEASPAPCRLGHPRWLPGSWPRKLAGLRGQGAREGDSAPGTLTWGPALHAPAAAPGPRRCLSSPPPAPPLPATLLGTALNIPRAPLPLSLFMAVSKLQPPLEQLRPLMGTRQRRRPGRPLPALPWPCPALPAPARSPPPPGSLGPGRAAQRSAQRARLAHQSKLSRPEGEHRARPLPLQHHPPRHLPQPLRQTGWEQSTSQAPSRGWGGGEREKGEGRGKGGSFSSFSLLAAPPAQAGK